MTGQVSTTGVLVNSDPLYACDVKPQDAARFWSKVDRGGGASACWPWVGRSVFPDGYGLFKFRRKSRRANRVALAVSGVDVPAGLVVRHQCDNRVCCNPAHLLLGTAADNARDAVERGRIARGDANGSRLRPERLARGDRHGSRTKPDRVTRGSSHWMQRGSRVDAAGNRRARRTRLTEDDVREIRRRHAAHETQKEIAASFGVSSKNVGYIVRRQTWAHIA